MLRVITFYRRPFFIYLIFPTHYLFLLFFQLSIHRWSADKCTTIEEGKGAPADTVTDPKKCSDTDNSDEPKTNVIRWGFETPKKESRITINEGESVTWIFDLGQ